MYILIYSPMIKIKIKIYNNMQLKYIKQIKPQHKVKPLHNWTDQIRGRSQRSLTLFIHLEKSTCCICISNQAISSYNSQIFYTPFSFGFYTSEDITFKYRSIILIKVYDQGSICEICSFRENFIHVIRIKVIQFWIFLVQGIVDVLFPLCLYLIFLRV